MAAPGNTEDAGPLAVKAQDAEIYSERVGTMVRSLAIGFGAVTMLAAAGSMTPAGQVILGVKHAAAAPATAAVVLQHRPAATVVQAQPAAKRLVPAPTAKRVVPAKSSPQSRPQPHRATVARRAEATPAPSGQSLNINQLLPLLLPSQSSPSLLSQTMPGASPLAGLLSGGSSLPDMLQQLTSPAPTPEPAPAPQQVQAPTPVAPAQVQSAPASGEQRVAEDKHDKR